MAKLDLSAAHEGYVLDFLKFARYKRTQCLKSVESAFSEVAESRLLEDTFTSDEVREMLDGLCTVLQADVGSDLIHSSHTSALLLHQLFQQAEKWHLKLQVDLSELESRELLNKIADFEKEELSSGMPLHKHQALEPLNTAGGDALLQMEIQRLKDENSKLQERVHTLEQKATSALNAKDRLHDDLLAQQTSIQTGTSELDVRPLQKKISALELELTQVKKKSIMEEPITNVAAIKDELAETSHKLLQVTAELEETKKDLERKFNETPQYLNLRKILNSKNETIKALRKRLETE